MADGPAILDECNICCEAFNNSTRSRIQCDYGDCKYEACKACVRQYLLGTTENPHCMNCKKAWPQNFMVMYLNRSFITNQYKPHRKQLLLDREISKLPETMGAVDIYMKCEQEKDKICKLNEKAKELQKQLNLCWSDVSDCRRNIENIKNGNKKDNTDRKKFILKCPNEDCRGYLSTQYKCDLCELYTCKDCIEIIGYSKEDPHECNEDSVKSAELIKKDTKPCPSCGTRIYKLDGCDQMWCIECHKAFSWKSGKVDNGVVHNPHYYQYQKTINNGQVPRNPGDIVCGGLIGWYNLRTNILNRIPTDNSKTQEIQLKKDIQELHRFINHITHIELRNAQDKIRTLENNDLLRIHYIIKKKTKEEFGTQIYRNDNIKQKLIEMLHMYEILSAVGIEMFAHLISEENKSISQDMFINLLKTKIKEYRILCDYCNKQFATISISYNNTVMQIGDKWNITTKKFGLAKTKKNANATENAKATETANANANATETANANANENCFISLQ